MATPLILIVDDHLESCRPLARLLRFQGTRAVCMTSGELALAYLRKHTPKLVILDLMMPGMDGLEVLRHIRADPRTARMPVVMLSAVSDPNLIEHAKNKGANDYWIKSQVDYSRLKQLINPYVGDDDDDVVK